MNYAELKQIFQELKRTSPRENLTAHIIFTEDSFDESYPLLSRTYSFSSNNKAFLPNRGGYSIFASCLDGTDPWVRLEWYMAEEGNAGGWKVEDCYILEQLQDAAAIPGCTNADMGDGTVCYCFGETCIQARETKENEKIRLEPLAGSQAVNGDWVELPIDRVYGYCTLLARHLNREG